MKNLYQLNGFFYITSDDKILEWDFGIGFALGVKGAGRGHFLFRQDTTPLGKLNAICHGAQKVILTNDPELYQHAGVVKLQDTVILEECIARGIDYVELELKKTTANNKQYGEGRIYSYKIIIPPSKEELEVITVAQEMYPSYGEDSCYVDLGLIEQEAFIAGVKWAREQLKK